MLESLVQSLAASQASVWINQSTWIWPFCETLHFIGLSLLLGVTGFFDLRLMGFFSRVSVAAARDLMPLALMGFAINLITGVVFLIGLPAQYAHNPVWWYKVGFIMLAGLNAVFYETRFATKVLALEPGTDLPRPVKFIGFVSLVAWLAVLYCGRMLPFLGDAY
ncbi:MAG TPA: hypothetical protein VF491_21855 [Vicinamibacterales bacterium]